MSLEVTELQGGGTRGRQILYFCKLFLEKKILFLKKKILSLKKTLKKKIVSGTHRGGFQCIMILTP